MARMTQRTGYRERNSTADRALSVLQMFSEARPDISAVDVAESLGVARSTAYRYLQTLVQAGFLGETGRGGFTLGRRILELGRVARKAYGLTEISVPWMRDLAERFHQTVLLTKLMGSSVVCLEREEAQEQYVRLSYERGSVLAINAGAAALVLLADKTDDQIASLLSKHELRRFTPNTLTEPESIIARVHEIQRDGYAITEGELDPYATGIAAPIQRPQGKIVAALSVVVIRSLSPEIDPRELASALVEAAAGVSEQVALLEL